ncbi:MAG TPA: tripartite tricarboxylate transporter substrate binding protein [Roseomonas sp.]|nr:tripartite tricarboxylate transporter substrate binding protein [Roseomonas sp.]
MAEAPMPRRLALPRRRFLTALGTAGLAAPLIGSRKAHAQDYPSRLIRYVVPYSPGATSDGTARVMARPLAARLGQEVVVENRAGAGGSVGARHVAESEPDGYVLLNASGGILSVAPYISPVGYDPLKDLAAVALTGEAYSLVAINNDLPVTSLPELVAFARARPAFLNYASAGVGSTGQIRAALLAEQAGFQAVHVPFPGSAPAINSILAGNCHIFIDPATAPAVRAGRMRALAVVGPGRWEDFPEVPNITEFGIGEDWPATGWYGLFAPGGTPVPVIERLNKAFNAGLADPEIATALRRLGLKPEPTSPEALARRVAAEYAASGAILKRLGIT